MEMRRFCLGGNLPPYHDTILGGVGGVDGGGMALPSIELSFSSTYLSSYLPPFCVGACTLSSSPYLPACLPATCLLPLPSRGWAGRQGQPTAALCLAPHGLILSSVATTL